MAVSCEPTHKHVSKFSLSYPLVVWLTIAFFVYYVRADVSWLFDQNVSLLSQKSIVSNGILDKRKSLQARQDIFTSKTFKINIIKIYDSQWLAMYSGHTNEGPWPVTNMSLHRCGWGPEEDNGRS